MPTPEAAPVQDTLPSLPVDTPQATPDEVRVQNILTRRRGRLGTIATSLSGLISTSSTLAPVRKTLLGE